MYNKSIVHHIPVTITLRPHQEDITKAMLRHDKGQVIVTTGGGKTLCMIEDTKTHFTLFENNVHVVVAPRILLAEQLCSEFLEHVDAHVMHVHSGETEHFSTTKADTVRLWSENVGGNQLIFTTYNSLRRIEESGIKVDSIYFDEAHNSVKRNFFPSTEFFGHNADRCYFFTATPKHSVTIFKPGMNDTDVYGQVICNVPATELVDQGYILPPKVVINELPQGVFQRSDCDNLISTIDDNSLRKILIAARSTKQIINLLSESNFYDELAQRGYSCMYITSKTGAIIDGKKVDREMFFNTLNAWGKDPEKKFVVLHHSILSEGINVSGLEAVLFMRNMDFVGISQSIGRVIRLGVSSKTFGLVCVPVYDKVGINTAKSVRSVVETIFERGEPAVSVIRR